jgi:hypothetical protein
MAIAAAYQHRGQAVTILRNVDSQFCGDFETDRIVTGAASNRVCDESQRKLNAHAIINSISKPCGVPSSAATREASFHERPNRSTGFACRFRGQITDANGKGKSALDTKLLVDLMQVKLDGSFGDIEIARDHFVGKPLGGKKHDLAFAYAQHIGVQGAAHFVHCTKTLNEANFHKEFTRTISRRNW